MPPTTLTARWIFPADQPPIPNGTITIQEGKILAVHPHGKMPPDEDLGDVAILPGFVNAHTHLDLSGLRGQCPPSPDFPGWLRNVIAKRGQLSNEQREADIETGLAECQRFGATLVGDIAGAGASWATLSGAKIWSVVFYELLGLTADRARAAWEASQQWLKEHSATPTCRPGLSPHAPYSVRNSLFALASGEPGCVSSWSSASHVPVAIHLAETRAEWDLLHHRTGPLVPFLEELGVYDPAGLMESAEAVAALFQGNPHYLQVHANYLAPSSARAGTVVYCPRTHALFSHDPHPFRAFLAKGGRVALGTDSLASNPDLDILAEARWIHRHHPDVAGDLLVRMLTLNGAEALGFDRVTGSLTAGKSADLVVLPVGSSQDPYEEVFGSEGAVVRRMWRGQEILEKPRPLPTVTLT